MLLEEFPEQIVQSTSCTTRAPRAGEIDGNHYHFLTKEAFAKKRDSGEFLEWAEVFGDEYGTLKGDVEALQEEGKDVLLVIDTQGAMQLKEHSEAIFIFIEPPSLEVLKDRLVGRRTESTDRVTTRLSWAEHELAQAKKYDYVITNDDLTLAYEQLKHIIQENM